MSNYLIKGGETITDVVLNNTALLRNWDAILDANGCTDWTPVLLGGQVMIIPESVTIDLDAIEDIKSHPVSNQSVPNLQDQIDAIFATMEDAPPVDVPVFTQEVVNTNTTYTVSPGDSIGDAVINATGTLANLDLVLTENGFDTWTPALNAGEKLLIPATITADPNAARQFAEYPVSNVSVNNVDQQIIDIFEIINDYWILTTSFWNDLALWKDQKTWID